MTSVTRGGRAGWAFVQFVQCAPNVWTLIIENLEFRRPNIWAIFYFRLVPPPLQSVVDGFKDLPKHLDIQKQQSSLSTLTGTLKLQWFDKNSSTQVVSKVQNKITGLKNKKKCSLIPGWLSEASDIGYQYGGFSEHLMMSLTDIFCIRDKFEKLTEICLGPEACSTIFKMKNR